MVVLHVLGLDNDSVHIDSGRNPCLAPVAVTVALAADPLGQQLVRGEDPAVVLPDLAIVDKVQVATVVLQVLQVVVKVGLGQYLLGVGLFVAIVPKLVPVHDPGARVGVGWGAVPVLASLYGRHGLGLDLRRGLFPLVQRLAGSGSLRLQLFGFSHNAMLVLNSHDVLEHRRFFSSFGPAEIKRLNIIRNLWP